MVAMPWGFLLGKTKGLLIQALHFAMKTIINIIKAMAAIAIAFFGIVNLGKKSPNLKEMGVE
jgi:hypothetical protein